MAKANLADRVAALEEEVARLKALVEARETDAAQPGWKKISGIFANDPAFEEAMRLGREYRESLRPSRGSDGSLDGVHLRPPPNSFPTEERS